MNSSSIYFAQKITASSEATSHDYSFLAAQSVLHRRPAMIVKEMAATFPNDFSAAGTFFGMADHRLLLIGIDLKIHPLLDRTFDPADCIEFLLDESSVVDRISDHPLSEGLNLTKEFSKISGALGKLDGNAAKALWATLCYGQEIVSSPILDRDWWSLDRIKSGRR